MTYIYDNLIIFHSDEERRNYFDKLYIGGKLSTWSDCKTRLLIRETGHQVKLSLYSDMFVKKYIGTKFRAFQFSDLLHENLKGMDRERLTSSLIQQIHNDQGYANMGNGAVMLSVSIFLAVIFTLSVLSILGVLAYRGLVL